MWSNSDFKTWIGAVNALSLSQDELKEEAIKFSPVFADLDKKTVLKRVEDFLKMEKKILTQASMLIFKEEGGSEGKMRGRNDVPPKIFFPKVFKMSQLRCDVCDFNLSDKDELKVHIKSKHEDVIKKSLLKKCWLWLLITNSIVNGQARLMSLQKKHMNVQKCVQKNI